MSSEDLFGSVSGLRISDVVASQIQELIIERRLHPGDALPAERELASLMSVSRNALREAIGKLCQKGLLETHQGKGTFVAIPSFDSMKESLGLLLALSHVDLVELCDVRLLIEPIQAALAAKKAGTSDVSRLQSALIRLRNSHDDVNRHVLADLEFHAAIGELAEHEVYASIVAVVREPVTRGMLLGTKVPRAVHVSDDQHDLIAQAILDGRSIDAERATREHLTYVREYLLLHRAELAIWQGYLE